jgi:hypothetical protein
MAGIPKLIIPSGVAPVSDTDFLYKPESHVAMAQVVARVQPNPPPVMEIANLLLQVAPHWLLELGGRNIAKRAVAELKAFKSEVAEVTDRLADLPKKAEKAISIAMLWNNESASTIYDATDATGPLYSGQTLTEQIEKVWVRLKRLHDAIPPDLDATPSGPGRRTETHIDELLNALKCVWQHQTNLQPDIPRHHGEPDEFVGDFLDFAWEAVVLARKFPNSDKFRLPSSKNALGERLARGNRTNPP